MTWTILIIKKPHNGWFVNYIENKLLNQIQKFNLQQFIEVLIYETNTKFYSDYVSVIDDEIDISDNYIDIIYNKIKTGSDCIGLKGTIYVNGNPIKFNNVSKTDNEICLPITKLNPIKTEIIFNKINNILYYINSENLLNITEKIDNVDLPVLFLEKTVNIPISIIITAYQTQDYIEECLDSIEKQTYFINNDNFEVLVGVDACLDTYNKLQEIKHKYRNLSIYMMSENKGTYITTNTLIDLVKNENVIRFDSDDIMSPNLIKEVFNNKKDNDIIMLGYVDIKDGKLSSKLSIAGGVIYFKKSVMDNIAGGYQPWKCAADSELMARLMDKVKIMQLKKILFYRRIHDNSLTNRIDTGHNSNIRNYYTKQIKSRYKDNEIKIKRIVNKITDNILINNIFIKNIDKNVTSTQNDYSFNNNEEYFYSIVIPTMWKSDRIFGMLSTYEKSNFIKEVIIIDNDPSKKPNLDNYNKVKYFTNNDNIFVNPSWNLGYSISKYRLILANDDITIYNFDNVIELINKSDYDIVGVSFYKTRDQELRIETINNFPEKSYGCFMYIKNYYYIPDQLKIWYGDKFLFDMNKKRGLLRNANIITDKSTTIDSNISLFRNKIGKNDIIEYEHIVNDNNKYDNDKLNIIIRTSNRPQYFYRCIESIKKYNPNAKLHITIDNYDDLYYVKKYAEGLDYSYYMIDKNVVSNICEKISITRKLFIYNYYINIVKSFLKGWCIILDDDDEMLINLDFERNINNIYLFKVDVITKIVPTDKNFGKEPKLNDISGIGILFHHTQMFDWTPQRGGDYEFIKNMYNKYSSIWINKIVSKVQLKPHFGKDDDLKDKVISVNMATYPPRKESLINCIKNLLKIDIIDTIRIYLNEYDEIPDELPKNYKITYFLGNENLKDSGKFYWSNDIKNEYYFTVDDDLIYPKSYFIDHLLLLRKYDNDIFVSLHGKIMKEKPQSFNDNIESYHCLRDVKEDVWINNCGTGVLLFDNSKFIIPMNLFKYHGMCDLWVSTYCQQNKIPILCRKHKYDELKYMNNSDTLFDRREEMKNEHSKVLDLTDKWVLYKK